VTLAKVAVLIGSPSDGKTMEGCTAALERFGIPFDLRILSAHRQPDETAAFARSAEEHGYAVIIAAAGMAAHLPGVIASHTTLPVIGVPLEGSPLHGLDSLYAMVQMPAGIPVATVAIGSAGARNAAVLAAEILALGDPELKSALAEFRRQGAKV
jgi:5-(carboxyamino)imidazole ribonucleotide mutase